MLTFSFQPLAAALFNVQDIFQTDPRMSCANLTRVFLPTNVYIEQIVNNLGAIGLNQNGNFEDLTCMSYLAQQQEKTRPILLMLEYKLS